MAHGPTWWDRVATGGNPVKMEARMLARVRMSETSRALARLDARAAAGYEGATQGHRWWPWLRSNASINVHLSGSLREMQSRHRRLIRDNPWIKRAIEAIASHWIGYGITAEIKVKEGFRISAANLKTVQKLWAEWYETTKCDADGVLDGYGMQTLMARMISTDGEVYIRARWRRKTDKLPVPLQIQLVSTDFCDIAKTQQLPTGRVLQGKEFDSIGRLQLFWMYRENPNDILSTDGRTYPIDATDVAHVYRLSEAGQLHGEPWGHANLLRAKSLDGYEDAFLRRQELANAWVGVMNEAENRNLFSAVNTDGTSAASNAAGVFDTEAGTMLEAPLGRKITLADPPKPDGYGAFTKDSLLAFAAGYGITYMSLTGDLTAVNFSSARMGYIDQKKNVDQWRWQVMIPQGLERIGAWFLESVTLKTGIDTSGLYFEYSPPPHELLDPGTEVPSTIKAIRAKLYSLKAWHRSQGERTRMVLEEDAEVNAMYDELGITSDADPRKVSQQGQEQVKQSGGNDGNA